MLATTTPSGDNVPNGLRVKGGINLFGFKARADILINPIHVKLFAEFSSFSLGFLRVSRSKLYFNLFRLFLSSETLVLVHHYWLNMISIP